MARPLIRARLWRARSARVRRARLRLAALRCRLHGLQLRLQILHRFVQLGDARLQLVHRVIQRLHLPGDGVHFAAHRIVLRVRSSAAAQSPPCHLVRLVGSLLRQVLQHAKTRSPSWIAVAALHPATAAPGFAAQPSPSRPHARVQLPARQEESAPQLWPVDGKMARFQHDLNLPQSKLPEYNIRQLGSKSEATVSVAHINSWRKPAAIRCLTCRS